MARLACADMLPRPGRDLLERRLELLVDVGPRDHSPWPSPSVLLTAGTSTSIPTAAAADAALAPPFTSALNARLALIEIGLIEPIDIHDRVRQVRPHQGLGR